MTLQTALTLQGPHVTLVALAEGADTSEIQVIPTGTFKLRDARGAFTLANPDGFIAKTMEYAAAVSGGEILIDFDHGAERKGVDAKRTAAAGWITGLRHDAEGSRIMATVRWTPAGIEALQGRVYRFISPVMAHDEGKNVLGIVRAGLTNVPAIGGMKTVAASTEDITMNELLRKLAAKLGLKDETDEAVITAAALDAVERVAGANAILTAASIEGAVDDKALAALEGKLTAAAADGDKPDPAKWVSRAAFDEMSQTVAALSADVEAQKAADLVAKYEAEGKITPAALEESKEWAAKDPKGFAAYFDKAPVVCAGGELLAALKPVDAGSADALTAAQKTICSSMGITEAQFLAQMKGETIPKTKKEA